MGEEELRGTTRSEAKDQVYSEKGNPFSENPPFFRRSFSPERGEGGGRPGRGKKFPLQRVATKGGWILSKHMSIDRRRERGPEKRREWFGGAPLTAGMIPVHRKGHRVRWETGESDRAGERGSDSVPHKRGGKKKEELPGYLATEGTCAFSEKKKRLPS